MGLLVTLHLISVNVYNSVSAPPERGFSYIELWMLGMQLTIIVALVEYGMILGSKKFFRKKNFTNIKVFVNRKNTISKEIQEDDTIFKNIDKTFLILSIAYLTAFSFSYWIFLFLFDKTFL